MNQEISQLQTENTRGKIEHCWFCTVKINHPSEGRTSNMCSTCAETIQIKEQPAESPPCDSWSEMWTMKLEGTMQLKSHLLWMNPRFRDPREEWNLALVHNQWDGAWQRGRGRGRGRLLHWEQRTVQVTAESKFCSRNFWRSLKEE